MYKCVCVYVSGVSALLCDTADKPNLRMVMNTNIINYTQTVWWRVGLEFVELEG